MDDRLAQPHPLGDEHGLDDGAGGYSGTATLAVADRAPVQARVQLVGHFDPVAGRFTWQGRIRGLAQALDPADPPIVEGTEVRVDTPYGQGTGRLSGLDAFGGHVVTGTSAPPFAQLPDDVER